ncbi:histone-lysine N-methyltransferase ASHR3-like [Phragmites australis]|uniref:histone-lysine N-methyltransferase ASHR3-like n=1 Tax=Phragmites australis TaxID=29695 RepID=UPI002D79361E|nr:histone-lysine N-methyltransferase ASHR3-like [Phragmites australis]
MPDLSTVYLPPFPELSVESAGDLAVDHAGDAAAAADAAPAPASPSASVGGAGGGGAPILPAECRWNGRVRTFAVAGAGAGAGDGAVAACPAARRGSGKKPSSAPSPTPARTPAPARTLEEHVSEWAVRKAATGIPARRCVLPFLTGAPKAVECRLCSKIIYAGEQLKCTVSRCREMFHLTCAVKDTANFIAESFKCPQHGCMVCKQKMFFWRCGRCTVAAHTKCAPWPVIHLKDDQGSAICWRHPSDWLLQNENAGLTNSIEEVFCRLPLPYVNEDFNIDSTIRDFAEVVYKPPPYTPIRRNVYLIKKKRAGVRMDTGCTNCSADSTCKDDCECRGLSMSCSKNCRCSDLCTNKPFRKDKKIKIVKTKRCGWGAVTLEPLEKGDFVIEYVGEVIDDATCEQRLWDIKLRGDKNFYMCEISKDFTIDATFKGNVSRFLNHSCEPNCKLEKWQVDGETRVGVFASRSIEVGEHLTYDYRFVHFGEKVKCHCEALNCQGYLGSQIKNPTQNALATASLQGQLLEYLPTQDSSASALKPMTHLLPWTNCIEVSFNLRSKRKINRLCWGGKRKRTSLVVSSTSMQTSLSEAPAVDLLSPFP